MYILIRCDCEDSITTTQHKTLEDAQATLHEQMKNVVPSPDDFTNNKHTVDWDVDPNGMEAWAWDYGAKPQHLVMWSIQEIIFEHKEINT